MHFLNATPPTKTEDPARKIGPTESMSLRMEMSCLSNQRVEISHQVKMVGIRFLVFGTLEALVIGEVITRMFR